MLARAVVSLLVLVLVALGCSDPAGPPRIEDTNFAEELGIDLNAMTRLPSGLYIQDLVAGSGDTVESGDSAFVYYTGWLPNGTEFDSSQPPDKPPLAFKIAVGGVIRGFAEGVRGMQVGGRRLLVIPPALGYGANPQGVIPKNSILVSWSIWWMRDEAGDTGNSEVRRDRTTGFIPVQQRGSPGAG